MSLGLPLPSVTAPCIATRREAETRRFLRKFRGHALNAVVASCSMGASPKIEDFDPTKCLAPSLSRLNYDCPPRFFATLRMTRWGRLCALSCFTAGAAPRSKILTLPKCLAPSLPWLRTSYLLPLTPYLLPLTSYLKFPLSNCPNCLTNRQKHYII